jgi:hypothetical protein
MKTVCSVMLGIVMIVSAVSAADQPAPRRVEVGDLVCEWFAHMAVGGPANEWRMSGWDVEPPGTPFAHLYYSWFKLVDKNDEAPVTIGRRFPAQPDGALTCWNHVAVVYEKKQPRLYLNGVMAKTGLTGNKIVHPSFTLGGAVYGYFQGRLGDVRIYNRALAPAEIEKLAKNRPGR